MYMALELASSLQYIYVMFCATSLHFNPSSLQVADDLSGWLTVHEVIQA